VGYGAELVGGMGARNAVGELVFTKVTDRWCCELDGMNADGRAVGEFALDVFDVGICGVGILGFLGVVGLGLGVVHFE